MTFPNYCDHEINGRGIVVVRRRFVYFDHEQKQPRQSRLVALTGTLSTCMIPPPSVFPTREDGLHGHRQSQLRCEAVGPTLFHNLTYYYAHVGIHLVFMEEGLRAGGIF